MPRVLNGAVSPLGFTAQYDVTRDGSDFLLNVPRTRRPHTINVFVNRPAALKK